MGEAAVRLQLLVRPECGLCEDMARDLSRLHLSFATIDIEANPALEEAYGEVIPVLFHGDREIARAPQTRQSLEKALKRAGLL